MISTFKFDKDLGHPATIYRQHHPIFDVFLLLTRYLFFNINEIILRDWCWWAAYLSV